MYTASFAFFEAIWEAGITHVFVNLGSDHPSIMEAIVKGQTERRGSFPRIITCPSEMVALSMADGYARLTNKPQCVIVHVDVGTQALGPAIHNASCGRAPVLIFAGLSPFSIEGEMRGSRTEFIHWIQDVPDQRQIVSQYCRYSGEIKTGKNIKQMVNRALQFATSDPKGPVYLMGAREVMEEEIQPYTLDHTLWTPTQPTALPEKALKPIAEILLNAQRPLCITGYSGRNHAAVDALVALVNTVKGMRVLDTGACDMCFPADHRGWLGSRYGVHDAITSADAILVLDCDVPWIPTRCKPQRTARVIHIDVDPLKQQMPVFYIDAEMRFKADAETACRQIVDYIMQDTSLRQVTLSSAFNVRWELLGQSHQELLTSIAATAKPNPDNTFTSAYLCSLVRKLAPQDAIYATEVVTNTPIVSDHIQATLPGHWINCGGGGLGWSTGGALGIKLASDELAGGLGKGKMVIQIVGDGTFMFSVPSSGYWISQRYKIPILTIVLNNRGWNAPRASMMLVHPDGHGSRVSNDELNIAFSPPPDYSGIARAASNNTIFASKVAEASQLEDVLKQAIQTVQGGTSAVVDAVISNSLEPPKSRL
ncbi:thiamine pyrophosphate enzyme, N-terminal TPP binding domain-containing protein [Aspergillus ambiguus]|uniref:thiamine pyrophosphate enzyme, N-terminal TPP binding domain-containing protein n=1 Tax=Aspergillus ambiguus TaxID=176160 RepID=UPI003CCD9A3F